PGGVPGRQVVVASTTTPGEGEGILPVRRSERIFSCVLSWSFRLSTSHGGQQSRPASRQVSIHESPSRSVLLMRSLSAAAQMFLLPHSLIGSRLNHLPVLAL